MPNTIRNLDEDQIATLEELFDLVDDYPDRLNQWEQEFVAANRERFEKYRDRTFFSEHAWGKVLQVLKKVRR